MGIFQRLAEKLGIIPENRTKKINEERENQKNIMITNLLNIGFSEDDVKEVIEIIVKAEKDIQEQKDLLIGTNINVDDVNLAMKPSFDEIRRLQQKMALDIRTKIAEIKQRKGI